MRINFNLQATKAYTGSSPVLPPGEYLVEIVSEQADQPLRNGKGTALVFEYQIKDGQYRGQRIRDWLNLGHLDQTARELGQRRLKAIGESVGLSLFNDTRELFNRPFLVVVSLTEFQGKERNGIEEYRPANLQACEPSGPRQSPAPAPQPEQQPERYW
ncbi:MAG: DUF669 domain-containing protein [Thermoguttaceae bacterium]|nr:DUF669 domain-containing protein [Thermoguttaceae bacterium]MBR4752206.1 DUF669 domain-containing protein [Thermoguttaceae bacterium]